MNSQINTAYLVLLFSMGLVSFPLFATAQDSLDIRLLMASPTSINADPTLSSRMKSLAESAIGEHCASCHGPDLEGNTGVPNLVDFEWIWGVTGLEMTSAEPVMSIMQTILYGVRDTECPDEEKRYGGCPDTRYSEMPGYGRLGWSSQQVSQMTELVLALSGNEADSTAVASGQALWPVCTECHGVEGFGDKVFGGPDLQDSVWLYGGSREEIFDVIFNGRLGQCPAWQSRLDMTTIKSLAVYIYNRSMGL